jgi:hypothetical protein
VIFYNLVLILKSVIFLLSNHKINISSRMKQHTKILNFILATLILIILVILLIYIFQNIFSNKTYYKCNNKHNQPMQNVLDINKYTRHLNLSSSMINPDLYLPCGYGKAELELYNLSSEYVKNSAIFVVPGCDILSGKDSLWQELEKVYSRDVAKLIMPETYITASSNDIELFKSKYHSKNIYILKKNIQRKEGIIILNNLMNILETIKNDPRYVIIQDYIKNPFLIRKRKINIRLYIAVVCKPNVPLVAYLYTIGKCIYTNQDYKANDITNLEAHLTSLNLDVDVYSKIPYNLKDLEKYIGTPEYNIIWKKIIHKLGMVMKAVNNVVCQNIKGRINFQLFGVDVMLNEYMEPWILEFNKGPDMTYKIKQDKEMKQKLYEDLFCLVDLSKDSTKCNKIINKWIVL